MKYIRLEDITMAFILGLFEFGDKQFRKSSSSLNRCLYNCNIIFNKMNKQRRVKFVENFMNHKSKHFKFKVFNEPR